MQKLALFLIEHVLLKGSSQLRPIYIYKYLYLFYVSANMFVVAIYILILLSIFMYFEMSQHLTYSQPYLFLYPYVSLRTFASSGIYISCSDIYEYLYLLHAAANTFVVAIYILVSSSIFMYFPMQQNLCSWQQHIYIYIYIYI